MSNSNSDLILKNTMLLYFRMLITMWLNLYATRLVLQNLGVDDMGVYGVVGSIVSLFTVLTNGLTTTIQRFITFELGLGKTGDMQKVFCTSMNIILILALVMVFALETGGIAIVRYWINIPEESRDIAVWVFQFCILTCLCNLIVIPYNALVTAYEKMGFYALISVINVALTCTACFCLKWIDSDSRLITYSAMLAGIALFTVIVNRFYCTKQFKESEYKLQLDKDCLHSMGKFAGISSLSSILQLITSQGVIIVINLIFGVALNAVYTIALQLKNMVLSFAFNILKAIQPQITKTYAEKNISRHKALVYSGSKAELYMILFILVPFMMRTEYILNLWLGEVPQYTVAFCRCTIILSVTYATFEPIRTAVYATNRIRNFMIVPDTIAILSLPLSYITGVMTESPESMIFCIVGMDILCCIIRLWLGTQVCEISIKEVINNIFVRGIIVLLLSLIVCYGLTKITNENISGFIVLLTLNSIALCAIIYGVGLNQEEKQLLARIKNKEIH